MNLLVSAPNSDARNMELARAMADVDVFYVQYRDQLLRSDNRFNAGVDLLSLMSDLAGRLTDSTGVKDNYLTLGALLNGSRATVNNRFLYAQTSLALVKGMDAARAATALAIKQKQSAHDITEYSGRDAYADVLKYYFDGTLAGGLIWLQAQAEAKEASDTRERARLRVPKPEELKAREDLYDEIAGRLDDRDALVGALRAWEVEHAADEPVESLRAKFSSAYRQRLSEGIRPDVLRRQLVEAEFLED